VRGAHAVERCHANHVSWSECDSNLINFLLQFYYERTLKFCPRARALSVFRMCAFHGRSFAREDLAIGDKVIGCNELLRDRRGVVRQVQGVGLKKRYFVEWDDGENAGQDGSEWSSYPKRSLRKDVPGLQLNIIPKRGGRVRRPSARVQHVKRQRGSCSLPQECGDSGAGSTDSDSQAERSEASSSDDEDAYRDEQDVGNDYGEGPGAENFSEQQHASCEGPVNIVQPQRPQQKTGLRR
jgi:hypothetical protein